MNSNTRKYPVFSLLLLFIVPFFLLNCETEVEPAIKKKKALIITSPGNDSKAIFNEEITFEFSANEAITNIKLLCNNKEIASQEKANGTFNLKVNSSTLGLGVRTVVVEYTNAAGKQKSDSRRMLVLSDIEPKKLTVQEIQSFEHNTSSYTQGLEFNNGVLYEGTGQKGESILAKTNFKTGEFKKKIEINPAYFGEGITIFNNKIYQITWQSRKCIMYDLETMEQIGSEMEYFGQGWGLTHDSTHLIMSNGSNEITFRNPETLTQEKSIKVVDNRGEIANLNELEYINGFIYANVYQTAMIVKIDPKTGQVLEYIDGTSLDLKKNAGADVFNGIALDDQTGKIYVTGKYWDKLYEVTFE